MDLSQNACICISNFSTQVIKKKTTNNCSSFLEISECEAMSLRSEGKQCFSVEPTGKDIGLPILKLIISVSHNADLMHHIKGSS